MNRREFLMSSACACLATATAKIDPLFAEDAPAPARLYRCGTPPPTPAAKIQANRVITALRTHRMNFRGQTLVPIRFHIIHDGAAGKLLDRQLKAQVAMLNTIYKPSGVQFKTIDVQEYEQPEWFRHEYGTPAEGEMKTALGKDTDRLPQHLYLRAGRRPARLCHLPLVARGNAAARRRGSAPCELPEFPDTVGAAALAVRSRHDGRA